MVKQSNSNHYMKHQGQSWATHSVQATLWHLAQGPNLVRKIRLPGLGFPQDSL